METGNAPHTMLGQAERRPANTVRPGERTRVKQFRAKMAQDEERLVVEITRVIRSRAGQSSSRGKFDSTDLEREMRNGLARMRVIEPRVRIVTKDVSWDSTRDREFTEALQAALPAEELAGWFEEFIAARQRGSNG